MSPQDANGYVAATWWSAAYHYQTGTQRHIPPAEELQIILDRVRQNGERITDSQIIAREYGISLKAAYRWLAVRMTPCDNDPVNDLTVKLPDQQPNALTAEEREKLAIWQEAFSDWLTLKSAHSQKTVKLYESVWRGFYRIIPKMPWQIRQADIARFVVVAQAEGQARTTINTALGAIGSFYSYAFERELVKRNPVRGVEQLRISVRKGVDWITSDELEATLKIIPVDTLQGLRDRLLFLLLWTGIHRVSAVVGLRLRDFSRRHDRIQYVFVSKGRQSHKYLAPAIVPHLRAYLSKRYTDQAQTQTLWDALEKHWTHQAPLPYDDYLFVPHTLGSRLIRNGSLSVQTARNIVTNWTSAAIGRIVRPHAIRHGAARWAYYHGKVDMMVISRALDHADVKTTQLYLELMADEYGPERELGELLQSDRG